MLPTLSLSLSVLSVHSLLHSINPSRHFAALWAGRHCVCALQIRVRAWAESYSLVKKRRQPLFVTSFMKCVLPCAVAARSSTSIAADEVRINIVIVTSSSSLSPSSSSPSASSSSSRRCRRQLSSSSLLQRTTGHHVAECFA